MPHSPLRPYPHARRLLEAAWAAEARLEAALAEWGLSLPKADLLAQLDAAGEPVALGKLAEQSACVKSNVTQLVDRLEKDGLVRRMPDQRDRRVILAVLTDEGRSVWRQAGARLADIDAAIAGECVAAESRAAAVPLPLGKE